MVGGYMPFGWRGVRPKASQVRERNDDRTNGSPALNRCVNQMLNWLLAIFSLGFERMERDRRRELQWIPDEDFRFGKRRRKSR